MPAPRRLPWLFLLALPLWLAMVAPGAAQTLTADINGDGISDRIEAGGPAGEVLVHLSGHGAEQRLRAASPILDLALADIDRDGDADLVATTAGHRRIRVVVWTNAGGGRLVSRSPARAPAGAALGRVHLGLLLDSPALGDLTETPDSVITRDSLSAGHDAVAGELLPAALDSVPTRPHLFRRAPRGPPALPLPS